MSHQVVKMRREGVAPCMTCPLCNKLFREATTIIECLHTFCRKCIYRKLVDEDTDFCPICDTNLGVAPLDKLRSDHNLQDIRAKIFPYKGTVAKVPEIVTPAVMLPAKRKERSLSSLVVSTPRVAATPGGMTGKRSKFSARKSSRGGSNFGTGKSPKNEDDWVEDQPESSSSREMFKLNNYHSKKQKSSASGPSKNPKPDKRRENGSEAWEGKGDPWKPLNYLVDIANNSKSVKYGAQGSAAKSEFLLSDDDEGPSKKPKRKTFKRKPKIKDEKKDSDISPSESEKPKKLRNIRQKKAQKFGDPGIKPQVVLDAASAKADRKDDPIWFSLVASDEQEGDAPSLPQIPANYIRIKDGSMPVSFIQKYLKVKLHLTCEDEVEIKCMGQAVMPTLSLSNLVDLWLQTTIADRVATTIGSSAKEFVMVLGYARRG